MFFKSTVLQLASLIIFLITSLTSVSAQQSAPSSTTQPGSEQNTLRPSPPTAATTQHTDTPPVSTSTQIQTASSGCIQPCLAWYSPDPAFTYGIPAVLLLGIMLVMSSTMSALRGTKWSLADALSEETEVSEDSQTPNVPPPADGAAPAAAAPPPPLLVTRLHASSSRLIAFMGSVVILFLFFGFGTVGLYGFATTGTIPATLKDVTSYLLAGLTLFAPYTVNKFAKLFETFNPKKP